MKDLIQRLRNPQSSVPKKECADALEKQQAEIKRLKQDYANSMAHQNNAYNKRVAERDAAQAEIEELRAKILAMACVQVDREEALKAQAAKDAADAGRYRWMTEYLVITHTDWDDKIVSCLKQAELDTAIDQAMKESQQ